MFVALERVDVQYAAKECSRGMSKPSKGDLVRIKRVVRYLKTTAHFEQFLEPQMHARNVVRGPVDSDWANDKIERMSTSAGQIYYIEALILAWARTQTVQALSSGEAESYALGTGACECLAVKSVLTELGSDLEPVQTRHGAFETRPDQVHVLAADGEVEAARIEEGARHREHS